MKKFYMFKCMTNRRLILQTQAHDVAIHAHFIPQTNFFLRYVIFLGHSIALSHGSAFLCGTLFAFIFLRHVIFLGHIALSQGKLFV